MATRCHCDRNGSAYVAHVARWGLTSVAYSPRPTADPSPIYPPHGGASLTRFIAVSRTVQSRALRCDSECTTGLTPSETIIADADLVQDVHDSHALAARLT